jgi:hypothetical protein
MDRGRREQIEDEAGVPVAQLLDRVERLRRQPPGVDAEDANLRVDRVRHVEEDDAVDLERGRERNLRRESFERPGDDLFRLFTLERDRQFARLQLVE